MDSPEFSDYPRDGKYLICSIEKPAPKDAPGLWDHRDATKTGVCSEGCCDIYTCPACGEAWPYENSPNVHVWGAVMPLTPEAMAEIRKTLSRIEEAKLAFVAQGEVNGHPLKVAAFADDKHMPTLIEKGMIEIDGEDYITTSKGWLFLDSRKSTSGADHD